MEPAGWVIGLVVCAAVAAILLVFAASQITARGSPGPGSPRLSASVLVAALGVAAAHAFTDGDEALHTSVGPWLLALGAVLVSLALLKPSIGRGRAPSTVTGAGACESRCHTVALRARSRGGAVVGGPRRT